MAQQGIELLQQWNGQVLALRQGVVGDNLRILSEALDGGVATLANLSLDARELWAGDGSSLGPAAVLRAGGVLACRSLLERLVAGREPMPETLGRSYSELGALIGRVAPLPHVASDVVRSEFYALLGCAVQARQLCPTSYLAPGISTIDLSDNERSTNVWAVWGDSIVALRVGRGPSNKPTSVRSGLTTLSLGKIMHDVGVSEPVKSLRDSKAMTRKEVREALVGAIVDESISDTPGELEGHVLQEVSNRVHEALEYIGELNA